MENLSRRTRMVVAVLAAWAVANTGCGSPTSPSTSATDTCPAVAGRGSMCAQIDGVAWVAASPPPNTQPLGCFYNSALLYCQGYDSNVSGQARQIAFALPFPTVGTQVFGGDGNVGNLPQAGLAIVTPSQRMLWGSEQPGGSGTVTITSLTTASVAGTFSFVLPSRCCGATGTRTITSGTFDITAFDLTFN